MNDEYQGRVELSHDPVMDFRGVIGVQVDHRDCSATELTPPTFGQSVGVLAVEHRDWNVWHSEFGGRVENSRYEPEGGDPERDLIVYSLSGGVIWNFDPGYSAGVSLTRGQRAPSLEELYNHGPHDATLTFEVGDPHLGPETANNVDFTLRKLDGRWTWRLNTFVNYIEDFIVAREVDNNHDGLADYVDDGGLIVAPADGSLLLDYGQLIVGANLFAHLFQSLSPKCSL